MSGGEAFRGAEGFGGADGERPSVEDELAELLERRAKRSKVDPRLVGRVGMQASASRQDRVGWWGAAVRSFAPARRTAASLVALVAILSLVGAALFVGGGSRPSASSANPNPAVDGYWAGGIPREVGGEAVNVGLDIQLAMEDATDDTPFLIGGWYDADYLPACSGRIGPIDPNPLGNRTCLWVTLEGGPRDLYFPRDFRAPPRDAPIVLRVHTHDPSAGSCLPDNRDFCRTRAVVESIVWFGDDATTGRPIGPAAARRLINNLPIADSRIQPDGAIVGVSADQFVTPHVCDDGTATGWPRDLFAVHGDPRLGLLAVFPDLSTREDFQASHAPAVGVACLGAPDEVVWAGEPSWVAHKNLLFLSFGDSSFKSTLADWLGNPDIDAHQLPLAPATLDLSGNTVWDYVEGRAFGVLDAVWGYRLVDRDSAGWQRDVDLRARHTALFGTIKSVDEPITESTVGARIWKLIRGTTDRRLFDAHYPGSTDPVLADERFLVVHRPNSTFVDWSVFRISGAPYPPASP